MNKPTPVADQIRALREARWALRSAVQVKLQRAKPVAETKKPRRGRPPGSKNKK